MGTVLVLVEAEEGGAAQQQWHRSASECAEAPRRGAVKPCGGGERGVAGSRSVLSLACSDGLHCAGLPSLSLWQAQLHELFS